MLHNVVVRNTCVQQKPPDLSVGSVTLAAYRPFIDARMRRSLSASGVVIGWSA